MELDINAGKVFYDQVNDYIVFIIALFLDRADQERC